MIALSPGEVVRPERKVTNTSERPRHRSSFVSPASRTPGKIHRQDRLLAAPVCRQCWPDRLDGPSLITPCLKNDSNRLSQCDRGPCGRWLRVFEWPVLFSDCLRRVRRESFQLRVRRANRWEGALEKWSAIHWNRITSRLVGVIG